MKRLHMTTIKDKTSSRGSAARWNVVVDHRPDTWIFVTYWLFATPIILSSFSDISAWMIVLYFSYMVVAYTACAWFIVNVLFPTYMPKRRYALGFFGLVAVVVTCAIGSELVDLALLGDSQPFWHSFFKYELPNDTQNIFTLVAILAGEKFFDERQRTTELESERRQSELSRLRAQVDPHFLFNSLNILDILIEDDPAEARHFVHRLSNLYRYLIRHRDEDLVPAAAELAYARDYHYLVQQRFGDSFRFRENITAPDLEGYYVPPGSLQTVLENVYKHNLATERSPVAIALEQREGALYISNDFSPKPGKLATHEQSGSGITNLKRRYVLLTDDEVSIGRDGECWVARLPLLRLEEGSRPYATTRHAHPTP